MRKIPAAEAIRYAMADAERQLGALISSISAINTVRVPDEWWTGNNKILMVGQETGGEDRTLKSMVEAEDGLADIVESYETFDFAENTRQRFSPFWRAHRFLANEFESGIYRRVMWTNLVEVQSLLSLGSSILTQPDHHRQAIIDWQAPIVRAEFEHMSPSAAVFFTGPNYDAIIERVFPGAKFFPVESTGRSTRVFARVEHPLLPAKSIRTYHPRALQQQKLWGILDQVAGFIRG